MSKPIKLGVGLLPKEYDPRPVHLGHMWLYWTQTEEDYHDPCRGFYPDIEFDSDKYKSSSRARREIIPLLKRGVPGRIEVDQRAIVWSTEIPERIISVEWDITQEQLKHLQRRCFIPQNQTRVSFGLYSVDKKNPKGDTCSSWLINIVNDILGVKYIICDEPKRLLSVQKALLELKEKDKR